MFGLLALSGRLTIPVVARNLALKESCYESGNLM